MNKLKSNVTKSLFKKNLYNVHAVIHTNYSIFYINFTQFVKQKVGLLFKSILFHLKSSYSYQC